MDTLQTTIKNLPHSPGVYLYKDDSGTIIYVGKARDLYKRVHQYFDNPNHLNEKTRALVSVIHSIEVLQVATEFEALLLEAKLIRTHNPKYNVIAKDDKSPIYIHLLDEKGLVRVTLDRRPKTMESNDSSYFGPFATTRIARFVLKSLRRSIPFCQQKVRNGRPCFYTHLGLCHPCPSVIQKMPEGEEKKAQTRLYRMNITRLRWVLSGQSTKAMDSLQKEMTSLAKAHKFEEAASIRNQIQALMSTIQNQYNPFQFEETDKLEKAPVEQSLELQRILQPHFPTLGTIHRIECYDISTIQGTSTVGSMVVFFDGIPQKDQYRKFKIRNTSDRFDAIMMEEMVTRRLNHPEWPMPDLIVVDGGKVQVSRIQGLLQSRNSTIPLIGLAKRFEQIVLKSVGGIYIQRSISLSNPALQLLQHIRDEAHRFAITFHKSVRGRSFLPSHLPRQPEI